MPSENTMSPRAKLLSEMTEFLTGCGLDEVYGCAESKDPWNKYRAVTFCRARLVDGTVRVYNQGFIMVLWQGGGRKQSAVLHSKQDALDFLYFQFVRRDDEAAQAVVDRSGLAEECRKLGVLSKKRSRQNKK